MAQIHGGAEMEDVAKFLFVGASAVALFTFLTVSHWISARIAERRDRERLALLRKVAEQPPETAALMRDLLREEDARMRQRARAKARQTRRDGLEGGSVVLAVGVGLAVFLYAIAPDERIWTLGIMIVLIGMVIAGFAYFASPDEANGDQQTGVVA
jgi:hypothetical protein